jgi:hypothetical protein
MIDTTKPNGDHIRPERLEYHVLPDDPVAALNILREAAGLEPWPAQGGEHRLDHPDAAQKKSGKTPEGG